jgi:hypothetical protein
MPEGMSDWWTGYHDGRFLAKHLANWQVADLIIRAERHRESERHDDWVRGNREGLTDALSERDTTWRVYAGLRA